MMEKADLKRVVLFCVVIGAVEGFFFWLGAEFWPESRLARGVVGGGLSGLAVLVLLLQSNWLPEWRERDYLLPVLVALPFAITSGWVWNELHASGTTPHGGDFRLQTWYQAGPLILVILAVFTRVRLLRDDWKYPYPQVYRELWYQIGVVSAGLVLTGLLAVILLLWASLFALLDIDFFSDLFTEPAFAFPAFMGFAGAGIGIGRFSERITASERVATHTVSSIGLPVLALAASMFLITLPFVSLQPLWETGNASSILLAMTTLLIILGNGVVEDGGRSDMPSWQKRVVEVCALCMPVLSALALYSTGLRVGQYGLTPQRIWALTLGGIGLLYGSGMVATLLVGRSKGWLHHFGVLNKSAFVLVAVVVFLLHTPALDPLRISLNNQLARLESGRVTPEDFDWGTLYFKLGDRGRAAVESMAEGSGPVAQAAATNLAEMSGKTSWWEWRNEVAPSPARRGTRTLAWAEESDLRNAASVPEVALACGDDLSTCLGFFIDLDQDGTNELAVAELPDCARIAVVEVDSVPSLGGILEGRPGCDLLRDSLETFGRVEIPRYRSLRIGDRSWVLQQGVDQ